MSHELTHDLENTKAYGALQNAILDRIGNLDQKVQEKIQSYERQGINMGADPETKAKNARYELVAEYVETQLLGNEKTIRQVVKQNRSLGEWVRDQIDKVLVKLGNTREKEAARERRELRRIRDIYAQALREKNEGPKGLELPKVASAEERSVTEQEDADYLSAVESGDIKTAQRMVDEAAETAMSHTKVRGEDGKLLLMHHGTDADFTIFDRNYIGQRGRFEGSGFNFTPYEGRARGYGKNVHAGYLNIESPLSATKKTFGVSKLAEIIRNVDPTGDNIIANYARDTNDYRGRGGREAVL